MDNGKPKVLLLTRSAPFLQAVLEIQRHFDVEVRHYIGNPSVLNVRRQAKNYDIIAVDKWFKGNARDTAQFVKHCRFFGKPMVALDVHIGDGDVFALKVAGCAFDVTLPEDAPIRVPRDRDRIIASRLYQLAENIGAELVEQKKRQERRRPRKIAA